MAVLIVRMTAALARWPRVRPRVDAACIFSFYPSWWTDPASANANERFFSSPPSEAVFLCWLHLPGWLWRRRLAIRNVIEARHIIVLQRFVPWAALLATLSPLIFWRTMWLARRLRTLPALPFAGVDVTPLVVADLERSLVGGERFQDELVDDAVQKAVRGAGPALVLYRAEFQPAEHALLNGLRGFARAAGFVHYPFGRKYLSIWDHSSGRRRSNAGSRIVTDRPLPDAMLTCGDVGRAHLEESGYPADRIAGCGPQRHAALLERLKTPRDRRRLRRMLGGTDDVPLFLVGVAIIEADTEALFASLKDALEGFGPCRIAVRTHPNRPGGDEALSRAVAALGGDRISILPRDVELYDAIDASDAMITIGSTVAFEAMALGCMPVVFENPSTYAATSLAEFTDALYVVHNARELGTALKQIVSAAPEVQQRRARWDETVARVLGDLSTPLPVQLRRAIETLTAAAQPAAESRTA